MYYVTRNCICWSCHRLRSDWSIYGNAMGYKWIYSKKTTASQTQLACVAKILKFAM
jgi:hypothetical protein